MKKLLLYLDEHEACENYIQSFKTGFLLKQYSTSEVFSIDLHSEFSVIFMMKGRLRIIDPSGESITIKIHEMCSLSPHNEYKVEVLKDAKFIICFFERPKILCDQFSISKLAPYYTQKKKTLRSLQMVHPIKVFVKNMEFYLQHKMYCRHLHDIKESEWLFLMRGFYTKEEAANFLGPVIETLNTFKNIVKSNYMNVSTVAELADICNMSTKTFSRRFQKEFNDTPKQWMLKQHAKRNGVKKCTIVELKKMDIRKSHIQKIGLKKELA